MQQCIVVNPAGTQFSVKAVFEKRPSSSAVHGEAYGQRLSGGCAGEEWVQSRGRSAAARREAGGAQRSASMGSRKKKHTIMETVR